MKKSAGFSLIELMIVVAIIAILAAIAIPNFMKFSLKAKTAEATTNLSAIRTSQVSFEAENDVYRVCANTGNALDDVPDAWPDPAQGFDDIGFTPDGNIRFSYEVDGGGAGAVAGNDITGGFRAIALGDLDEDGSTCGYYVDTSDATYPKAVKDTGAIVSDGDDY
jgi:type IV pilus assembly protein PilA